HGKSDPPHNKEFWKEEYKLTAEHYCNFIIKLCEALDLKNPIFMGSSFGGNVTVCKKDFEDYRIGIVTGVRGDPVEILEESFSSEEAVEHAIFLKRILDLLERHGQ
ncbi:hypothetical protein OAM09_04965, partial [Candidatus Pelagibacter sp.]|nr:hypothetical protein [Candidatus Pelagibacter sp.]